MRILDLLSAVGDELHRRGAGDCVIIVDPKCLSAIGTEMFRDSRPGLPLPLFGEIGGAVRLDLPSGFLIVTAPERIDTGPLLKPRVRGKCEHGIPAEYCTPCEMAR